MGSFDISCSLTHTPITCGDRIVFFPLIKQSAQTPLSSKEIARICKIVGKTIRECQGLEPIVDGTPILPRLMDVVLPPQKIRGCSSYIYPFDDYAPISLPVKGTYDDGGSIKIDETPEANVALQLIEEWSGIAGQTVIKHLTDPSESDLNELIGLVKRNEIPYDLNLTNTEFFEKIGFTVEYGDDIKLLRYEYIDGEFSFFRTTATPEDIVYGKHKNYHTEEITTIELKLTAHSRLFSQMVDFMDQFGVDPLLDRKYHETMNILKYCGGCYVHEWAYDKMVEIYLRGNSEYTNGHINEYVLQSLGFTLSEIDSKEKRFNKVYTHPSSSTLAVATDSTFSKIFDVEKSETLDLNVVHIYYPKLLVDYWFEHTGHKLEIPHDLFSPEIRHKCKSLVDPTNVRFAGEEIHGLTMLSDRIKISRLDSDDLYNQLFPFACFHYQMHGIGFMYHPTATGPQFGDYKLCLELNEITSEFLKKKISEMDE